MAPGAGYIPNPVGHRAAPARLLLGGSRAPATWADLPSAVDLRPHFPAVMDQGQTSACVGHGTSAAIFASFSASGDPLPFVPSPLGIYTLARAVTRAHDCPDGALPALADEGAIPADAIAGLSLYGVRPMGRQPDPRRYSDADESTVADEPTLGDLELDACALVIGEHAVTSLSREARAFEVASLLACGTALGFGMFVDRRYQAWRPHLPPIASTDESDPTGGGHWQALAGYERHTDGECVFRVRGSWGVGAGDRGDWLITSAMLAACTDVTAIRAQRTTR